MICHTLVGGDLRRTPGKSLLLFQKRAVSDSLWMMCVLVVGPRPNGWILEEGSTPFTEFYLLWLGTFVRRQYLSLSLPNLGTSLQFSHYKQNYSLLMFHSNQSPG